MAATAKLLEPIERLFEEAPAPSKQFTLPSATNASPKAIAERIVEEAERDSRAWLAKFSSAVNSLRETNQSVSFMESLANYIAAQLDLLTLRIDQNRAESEEVLNQVPPPAPLAALRVIVRGLDRVYTHQHSQLVDIYYRAMGDVWDLDPEARGGEESASTADEVADFFKRARGS